MTRKPGRPPLPRTGTTQRRLPVHATDDEYNALMAALHADTRERFFQLDGAVTDYNIHVDEIAAKLDDAIKLIIEYGQIDGAHHKQWGLDQVLRQLAGDEYDNIVPQDWDTGVAP